METNEEEEKESDRVAPIATVGELKAAIAGLADDAIVMYDGHIYVGPGSRFGEDDEDDLPSFLQHKDSSTEV